MQKIEVEVYSDGTNAAVVRMPERQFPGLVVQGDKLMYLSSLAKELCQATEKSSDKQVVRLAGNLRYEIMDLLEIYAEGCRADTKDLGSS